MAGLRERFPPRRVLRLLGWNILILFVLLMLAAGGAEVYLRTAIPFRENVLPVHLEPGVGVIRPPHAEVRFTNSGDFWQVSRANGLGFLDREPPDPARAAESCHVTFIGDSFVEELRANRIPRWPRPPRGNAFERTVREWSYLADTVWAGFNEPFHQRFIAERPGRRQRLHWADVIGSHPRHRDFMEGWEPLAAGPQPQHLLLENPPPVFREALDVTRFALEQFRERTERDGAARRPCQR